ncbi:MAG TPA: CDP-alcohol phosphatidyltransferase family protein [Candidatus Thermoplasmatota archaeon]|nr:CDP-alcohol phosphatidyltransferase family protein [Candidatus Thermoplasmatota archaeon]
MLGGNREWTRPFTDAVGRAVAATRLSPNAITVLQLVLTLPVAWLLWQGPLVWGGLAMGTVASLDFVDGTVARITGRISKAGGYLDSMVDRFVDVLLLLPLLLRSDDTRTWIAGSVFLFAMTVTSFARARLFQDMRPPPAGMWKRDVLERPDRYLLLVPAVIAQGVLDELGSGDRFDVLFWVLVVLAALSLLTVLQRMRTAMRLLGEVDARGE